MENGPGLKMYFVLNMGIFQPAMSVYQRVTGLNFFPISGGIGPYLQLARAHFGGSMYIYQHFVDLYVKFG